MSRTTNTQLLERPKAKRKNAAKSKMERMVVRDERTQSQHAEFDRLVDDAIERLDRGDYEGFWDGIEEINKFNVLNRG